MNQLMQSFIQRPYVLAFLITFLVLGWRRWGWPKTVLWLVSGYLIAWASELSSIHNGFPYGHYKYIYENMPGELMVAGVPFFDSLSYSFLTFAGFMTAAYLLGMLAMKRCAAGVSEQGAALPPPAGRAGAQETPLHGASLRTTLILVIFGAFMTMLIDIIIDPLAVVGDKWFLGKIHYYVHPGFYFGVPLTNFGGWFLVAFAIIGFNVTVWHAFPRLFHGMSMKPLRWSLEPLFYISIALFIIVMAFWIGELLLGAVNSLIIAAVMAAVIVRARMAQCA